MHESPADTVGASVAGFMGLARAVDSLSSAIAGFALFAGARAFTFIVVLTLREPVMGGAGLVLLALIGWLRWQCRAHACKASRGTCRRASTPLREPRLLQSSATCAQGRETAQASFTPLSAPQSHFKDTPC
ncbi:hypothetical protein P3T18_002783 [Paraburkholderia sp. GAS199]|uniref:hypothetical protein n=1 Tax=Paraburkholderia sp. GAS199 TaxID=3035126 RepID=UPI003D209DCD